MRARHLTLVAALTLVQCGPNESIPGPGQPGSGADEPPGAGAAHRLVIVSPHWEGIRSEFSRAFERHMAARGLTVELSWLDPGGTSACLRFVKSRFAQLRDGIGVDLFFGGGVEPHLKLAADGLIDPVTIDPELLAAVPSQISGVAVYDATQGWYGVCLTTFGVVFNRELLRRLALAEPTSFGDLGEPQYWSWVALADPRMSGTVHMIYELILQGRGWENGYRLVARMAGNARRFYQNASEVPIEVGAGEAALGLSIDSYAWAQVDRLGKESMDFIAPRGESVINPDAISVLRGAPNRELAIALIEFALSREGQALWMLPEGSVGGPEDYPLARLPVRPDIYAELGDRAIATYDPFADGDRVDYDPELGSARWGILNALLGTVLIDLHRDHSRAWREVIEAGRPAAAEELLTRPPVGAEELLRLVETEFSDHSASQTLLARWSREARARIDRARQLARAAHRAPARSSP